MDPEASVRFSVVIPAHNERVALPRTLAALAAQDFTGSFEVIVVDNDCTDDTAEIAIRHGARVVHEPTRGVCHAREAGTVHARGEIVVSTDADTVAATGWLSRIDRGFRADPQLVAIGGPCRFVDGPAWAPAYSRLLFGWVDAARRLTGQVLYVTATNVAFRRSAWTGYDTRLTQGGDELDLLRRLRRQGRVRFDPGNVVETSSRRLEGGVLHSLLVCLLYQYFLAYGLNRLTGRAVIPTAPPVRGDHAAAARPVVAVWLGLTGIAVLAAVLSPDVVVDVAEELHRWAGGW